MARSFFNFGISFSVFTAGIGLALLVLKRFEEASPESGAFGGRFLFFFFPIFLFSASLGMIRYDISDFGKNNPVFDSRLNQKVAISGIISGEPDERQDSVRLTVTVDTLTDGGQSILAKTKVLAVVPLYPKFSYGDRLELFGVIRKPENFADPSGKIFDYQSYLAVSGIYYQIIRPTVTLIDSNNGNFVVAKLFALKHAFIKNVSALIPEPHASLLGGLVVGAKQSLGKNLLDDFRIAGVIHIVVLSGYNITIVADAVMKFFGFLPRAFGQSLGAFGIILFAIMVGGSATVIRASIMALLVILARSVGRKYDIAHALYLAGFLMVLQNPKILAFDSSFQLSFMSTIALIFVSPIIEKYFLFVTEKFGLRSVVVATISTQIFVLPMLLYKMGQFSVVALPVNLLILSAIPATMFFGFLCGIVGFLWLTLAFPFAFISYVLLDYELRIVEFFSHLPYASVAVGNFPMWLALLWYGFYLGLFWRFKKRKASR